MADQVKEKKPNPVLACCSGFGRFLYNPDDSTVLGRGGSSWAKILVFYLVFYGFLAGFFGVCLHVMLMTIDDDKPTVIGRTNKPYVAIGEKNLYTMNFKDDDWLKYKTAAKDLKEKYAAMKSEFEKKGANATVMDGLFDWEGTLGVCGKNDSEFAINSDSSKKGCFFMGLNRVIGYTPKLEKNTEHLAFNCSFDVGKSGRGNTDNPPFTIKMIPAFEKQTFETYFPWTSLAKNGLQPVAALEVVMDVDAAKKIPQDKLETYVKCDAYARNVNGSATVLKDSRPAVFTIEYKF